MSTIKRSNSERGRIGRAWPEAASEEEIARQISQDPDTAPEVTDADLKCARIVRPLRPAAA